MATLQFKGKAAVWNHHLSVPYHTLEKDAKKSLKGTDDAENLIIEGDNLLALKALLPQYQGRIKCIYIDPPYNTGNENWVYSDNVSSPMIKDWLGKTVGKEGEDLVRHDKWLSMMTPRLKLLRELLADDGAIFISIDDNEQYHLRMLLNEIFGESNFVAVLVWHKKLTGGYDSKFFNVQHEYVFVCAKDINQLKIKYDKATDTKYVLQDADGRYYKWDSLWNVGGLTYSPSLDYTIEAPDGTEIYPPGERGKSFWLWSKEKVKAERDSLKFEKKKDGQWRVYKKVYASDELVPASLLKKEIVGGNTNATAEIKQLFDSKPFDYAKPSTLIKYLIAKVTDGDDIVLDSFAGSGTTAHAVLDLNAEDGGARKFILVEMEDYVDKLTTERVRTVLKKQKYDVGYSYYTLGPAIDADTLLEGKLPKHSEFAKYVYYLATGKNLADEKKIDEKSGFVGKTESESIWLLYKQDMDALKGLAITLDWAQEAHKKDKGRKVVYAPACYLDDETLDQYNIKFVSIPYNLFERQS